MLSLLAQQETSPNETKQSLERAADSVRESSAVVWEAGRETWTTMRQQTTEVIGVYLPNILAAIAVLVIGWLLALIVAAVVRGIVRRTRLDERLLRVFASDPSAQAPQLERRIGKGVFWLLMLFVLIAFFHTLRLTAVTEPLTSFLNSVFEYLPRLIAAGLLFFVAWVIATVLRYVIRQALMALRVDRRLSRTAGVDAEQDVPVTTTVAEATYWLVFLLFLPAVLNALSLPGLLGPVQSMVGQILAFLPNLFAAALVLAVGWLVARMVQQIISNVLSAVGLDRLSARWGVSKFLGEMRLSMVLGLIVYILVLLPVIVAALNALDIKAVTQPASDMLREILGILPDLVAAILVIAITYIVGRVVTDLVVKLLSGIGFDRLPVRLGLAAEVPVGRRQPSEIAGYVLITAIMLFAAMQGLSIIGLDMVAEMISGFLVFAFNVLLGLVILGFGLYFGQVVANVIRDSNIARAELLSRVAQFSVVILASAMALQEMGLATDIVELAFGLILGAIAVATAIAFGIGGREVAKDILERVYQRPPKA